VPARKTQEKSGLGQKNTNPIGKKLTKVKQGRWFWLWLGFSGNVVSNGRGNAGGIPF
jgi:hypothetical protein